MAPAGVSIALALASSLASTRASLIAPQPAQRPSPAQTKRERALLLQRKADIAALQAERYALQAQALRLERELERVEERQEEERHIEPSPLDPIQLSLLDPSDGSEESIEESPVHRFSQVSIETEEEYLKVWWELGMPSFGFPTRPLDAPTIEVPPPPSQVRVSSEICPHPTPISRWLKTCSAWTASSCTACGSRLQARSSTAPFAAPMSRS